MFDVDDAIVQYAIAMMVNLYGACLFFWWWAKNKHASFVFMCITFLFTGAFIEKAAQVYFRYIRLTTCSTVLTEDSAIWAYKGTISILASLVVVIYLTRRAMGYGQAKRNGDRSEE